MVGPICLNVLCLFASLSSSLANQNNKSFSKFEKSHAAPLSKAISSRSLESFHFESRSLIFALTEKKRKRNSCCIDISLTFQHSKQGVLRGGRKGGN